MRFPAHGFPRHFCGLLLTLLTLVVSTGAFCAEKSRSALVIGNARYEPEVGKLRNTDNDARLVAQTLRELGFKVIEKHDLTRDQLLRATEEFRKTLPGVEVAFFYYAGHGISVAGENYLIPIKSGFNPDGADATTLRMLAETRLFNVQQAVADMSASGSGCNLVVLDACRNTPLLRGPATRSWASRQGLAEMTPPAGSLIAFATDAGQTALDGEGSNGLYTRELLKHLRSPQLTIEQVFKRTRADVVRLSDGSQIPAEYSRLIGDDIYLAGSSAPVAVPVAEKVDAPPALEPAIVPNVESLQKLALGGQTEACLEGLKLLIRHRGPGAYTVAPLDAALEVVKNTLEASGVSEAAIAEASKTCSAILKVLPSALPLDDPRASALAAKAYNRRGDALLLLNQPEEAISSYNTALSLDPQNSYIIYNRGRAHLALHQMDEARADFTEATQHRFNQPKARKLAAEALAKIP